MNNLFDTIEEAEAYLKIRQTESLSNIKDRGDVLLTDSSMVVYHVINVYSKHGR